MQKIDNEMISLFIFKSNARGMQYGIGTYISELTQSLLAFPDINIFIISYKSNVCKEFSVNSQSERLSEVIIPNTLFPFTQSNRAEWRYASSVVKLLCDIVPETGEVVFQINYIDDLPIAEKLKEYFKVPVISIVHFAQWQQIFDGNRRKLARLNIEKPTNNIEFTLSREREMYLNSDHIVSVTRYMKDFLVDEYGIHADKISVIPNGLDMYNHDAISEEERNELKQKLGFGKNEQIILFSGRIDPCKGVIYLMEAFEEACKNNSDLRLVLLGQGFTQDCQKRIQSFFGKVTYTGFLPKETVSSFYKIADIGIAPSIYDHCPYTVLEMMANRVPLIVSRINGLDELLTDEECQFIDPVIGAEGDISFNIKELSQAILTLAADKALRTRLAINSHRHFVTRFLAARMAEEMNNLFHSLAQEKVSPLEYEKSERR
jgi:glycosyltransferase